MKTILFNTESYTTAIRLIPVIKALRSDGRYKVVTYSSLISAGGPAKAEILFKLFKTHSIPIKTNVDFGLEKYEGEISKAQTAYLQGFSTALQSSNLMNKVKYRKVPILKYAANSIAQWNAQKIRYFIWFEKIREALNPQLLINAYDVGGIKRYYTIAARTANIPTLTLKYGNDLVKARIVKKTAEYHCIWGEYYRDDYIQAGVSPDKLFVTGCPGFDEYFNQPFNKIGFLKSIGLDPAKKTVIFSIIYFDIAQELEALLKSCSNRNDVQFICKPHPDVIQEDIQRYKDIINQYRTPCIIAQNVVDPLMYLRASDILIGEFPSNFNIESLVFGLERILLRKHSTFYNFDKDHYPTDENKYSYIASNTSDLVDKLRMYLENGSPGKIDPAIRQYQEKFWYRLDGKATQRVIEAIDQIIHENSEKTSIPIKVK